MWVFDIHTLRIVRVNEAAVRAYAYPRQEFLALTVDALHPTTEHQRLRKAISQLRRTAVHKTIRVAGSWTIRHHEGMSRDVRYLWHRLPLEHGLVLTLVEAYGKGSRTTRRTLSPHTSLPRKQDSLYLASLALENVRLLDEVQRQHETLKSLSCRLLDAQERERRVLALELHDDIGQALTAVKLDLRAAANQQEAGSGGRLKESLELVDDALQRIRGMALNLRPSLLDDFGLIPALRWLIDRCKAQAGFSVDFWCNLQQERFSPEYEITCFRIAQEALTNIMRHAKARRVTLELRHTGEHLLLLISDDGAGFPADDTLEMARHGRSLGLLGMRERAMLVGGEVKIFSRPGEGTLIQATLPMTDSGGVKPAIRVPHVPPSDEQADALKQSATRPQGLRAQPATTRRRPSRPRLSFTPKTS